MKKGLISAVNLSGASVLYAPASFKVTPIGSLAEVSNGCGAAGAKFDFVPDRIYGTYIGEASHIHDWMYHEGRTIEDKDEADRVFLNNILRLIKKRATAWYKPTFLMRIRAKNYYNSVKLFGGPAFWDNKPGN